MENRSNLVCRLWRETHSLPVANWSARAGVLPEGSPMYALPGSVMGRVELGRTLVLAVTSRLQVSCGACFSPILRND